MPQFIGGLLGGGAPLAVEVNLYIDV